jgi:hypothetical protein
MDRIQKMANEAVFILQMDSESAIRYICRNADCDYKTAHAALADLFKWGH